MAKRYSVKDVYNLSGKKVFCDTNVLIYLSWPTGNWHEKMYSNIFAGLLRSRSKLYVDYLVISELVNRISRVEYQKLRYPGSYKNFRDSEQGRAVGEDIKRVVEENVLPLFDVVSDAYAKDDIQDFLEVDTLDFIDKAIVSTCKKHNCVLLTNDADFNCADVDILTGNKAMLRK